LFETPVEVPQVEEVVVVGAVVADAIEVGDELLELVGVPLPELLPRLSPFFEVGRHVVACTLVDGEVELVVRDGAGHVLLGPPVDGPGPLG